MIMPLLRYSILLIAFLLSGCLSPFDELSDGTERIPTQRSRLEVVARYNHQDGMPIGLVERLVVGPQGQVYAMISHFDEQVYVGLLRRNQDSSLQVSAVTVDGELVENAPLIVAPDGHVLVLTENNVAIIENHNNQLIFSQSIFYPGILGLGFDQERLYVGRGLGGIAVYDHELPQNPATVSPNRILGEGERYSFFTQGNHGRLYAETRNRDIGIIDTHANHISHFSLVETSAIMDMVFDTTTSRLMVSTTDNGLYLLSENGDQILAHFTTTQGLASNRVAAVGVSSDGNMILVGFDGGMTDAPILQVIIGNQVRESYTLADLQLSNQSSITAITHNPIDGNFYVGTSQGDLIVLRPRMQADKCVGVIPRHPLVGRLKTQEYSSVLTGSVILPEPPDLSRPFTLELPASRTKTEYYKEWYDYIFDVLRTFTGAHGQGSFSGVRHRELRDTSHQTCAADQSEVKQQLSAWKSYREEQYLVTFQPYASRRSDDQTSLPRLGGTSAFFGQVHEEMPGFVSVTRNSNATTIVVQATSTSKAVKNITLQASWHDGTTTRSLSDRQTSHGRQQLRLKVLDHPADDYYWGMLMICLEETQNSTMGYELLVPFVAGRPQYQKATIEGSAHTNTDDEGIVHKHLPDERALDIAARPHFSYETIGGHQYKITLSLEAKSYSYYGLWASGPDYIYNHASYKVVNVITGEKRWVNGEDFGLIRFNGDSLNNAKTRDFPAITLNCEEKIIGMRVKGTHGRLTTFLGIVGVPLDHSYYTPRWWGWGETNAREIVLADG